MKNENSTKPILQVFLSLFSVQRSDTQIGKNIRTQNKNKKIVLISPDLEAALQPYTDLEAAF